MDDRKTGRFEQVYEGEDGLPKMMQDGVLVDLPVEYPVFTEGEVVEVKGWRFLIQRVNASTLVLRPCTDDAGGLSARKQMQLMT